MKITRFKWLSFAIAYLLVATCLVLNVFSIAGLLKEFFTIGFLTHITASPNRYVVIAAILGFTYISLMPVQRTIRERKKPLRLRPLRIILFTLFSVVLYVIVAQLTLEPVALLF